MGLTNFFFYEIRLCRRQWFSLRGWWSSDYSISERLLFLEALLGLTRWELSAHLCVVQMLWKVRRCTASLTGENVGILILMLLLIGAVVVLSGNHKVFWRGELGKRTQYWLSQVDWEGLKLLLLRWWMDFVWVLSLKMLMLIIFRHCWILRWLLKAHLLELIRKLLVGFLRVEGISFWEFPYLLLSRWHLGWHVLSRVHHLVFLNGQIVANELSVHFWKGCLFVHNTHISQDWHIEIGWEGDCARFRKHFKPVRQRILPIEVTMIIGTVGFLTGVTMQALLQLEVFRMKFLLFPSMTEWTPIF